MHLFTKPGASDLENIQNMMRQLLTLTIIIAAIPALGQTSTHCKCPKNIMAGNSGRDKPDTSFTFPDNRQVILCGYKEIIDNQPFYSEFILQVCGHDSILDFWPAISTNRLFMVKDTLKVVGVMNLPTGTNRAYTSTDWAIDKIYFSKGQLKRVFEINRAIRKYNKQEIQKTLKEFETAKAGINDSTMVLANRLFISAISGSRTAEKYFLNFESKIGQVDGAFAEEYKELIAMLELWTEK
jgi:hypothetical protein